MARVPAHRQPLVARLLWFLGLWAVGVIAVTAISLVIKLMIGR